jgi:periplasmic protein TonB
MAYKFFDTLLDSKGAGRTKRKLTLPVSIAIHLVVLTGVMLVPLLTFSELPEPVMSGAIRAFLVEAAPPPPPPPPPPPMAASAPRPVTQPKVEQPKPVTEEPKFTAPVETPRELPRPEEASGLDSGPGEPGGEIGGVAGGVSGGSEGGVVGGTIGGVVGGELGGTVGGVVGAVAPPAPPPPPVPSGPVRVGGQIKPPSKLSNASPIYPPMAKQARVEGTVILEATISPQGRVTDVKVLRGIPLLDNAAINAVRQWHYSPTRLNGTPVPVIMTVTVNFRLSGDGRSAPAPAKAAAPAPVEAPAEAPAPPAEAAPETVPPPSL